MRGIKKIPLGDVAIAMLNCIQAMHENGNLFVDVKPENFMLSSSTSAAASSSSSKRSKADVSQRVRLIDFGLVERFGDMAASKHRENMHPNAPLVGTPTYASLNIMSGHTASLRDDVEALGYVICELILMMASTGTISSSSGGGGVGKSKKKKDNDNILPWSNAKSDEDLLRIKSQEMDKSKRSKSILFAKLKAAGADTVMDNYFAAVTSLAYSGKPDYTALRCYLEKLVVTVGSNSFGSVETKTTTTTKKGTRSPVRKASAVQEMLDDDDDISDENMENYKPPTRQKRSAAKASINDRNAGGSRKTRATRDIGTQSDDIEIIDVDSINDEDDDDAMDWDPVEPAARSKNNTGTKGEKHILVLDIIAGPHKGHVIPFGGTLPATVCVGKDPTSRAMKDAIKFALSKDTTVSSPVHVKFVLNSKSSVHSVKVTDMSSSSGTIINGSSLPSGKSKQAFVGDQIKVGGSLIQIRKA